MQPDQHVCTLESVSKRAEHSGYHLQTPLSQGVGNGWGFGLGFGLGASLATITVHLLLLLVLL